MQAHLPETVRMGLHQMDEQTPKQLDPSRPVSVYCADQLCCYPLPCPAFFFRRRRCRGVTFLRPDCCR